MLPIPEIFTFPDVEGMISLPSQQFRTQVCRMAEQLMSACNNTSKLYR